MTKMDEDKEQEDPIFATYKFRNYVPRSEKLKKYRLPQANHLEIENKIDQQIEDSLNAAAQQDVLSRVLPKRSNWDLKRDVDKKLQILATKTDRVIIDLIRKKISDSHTFDSKNTGDPQGNDEISQDEREAGIAVIHALDKLNDPIQDLEADEDD